MEEKYWIYNQSTEKDGVFILFSMIKYPGQKKLGGRETLF